VGGSAGACFAAVRKLAADLAADLARAGRDGAVLTFFADRGELYSTTLLE
jgi:hypothetical protein